MPFFCQINLFFSACFYASLMIVINIPSRCALLMPITPSTTPEQIITSQLEALQRESITDVYALASPRNKQQVGTIRQFEVMIRGHPYYRSLLCHRDANILLESSLGPDTKQYLVRVNMKRRTETDEDASPNPSAALTIKDFWWSLSRVSNTTHPYHGCFMVDAVLPAAM